MQTEPSRAGGAIPRPFVYAALSVALWATAAHAGTARAPGARVGRASWYGDEFRHRRTASGTRFEPLQLTGAHRTLPIGSKVRITNLRNGRSVYVTINDRGPYRGRREIDVSFGAARALGMATIKVVDPDAALGELEGVLGFRLR